MKLTDLSANTDLLPLWPEEGDHGVYMRPMTQGIAKRLRAASQSAARAGDLASAAEQVADDAELAADDAKQVAELAAAETADEARAEAEEARAEAEEARAEAEEARAEAESANGKFVGILSQVVVDGRGEPLEVQGPDDYDAISPTLIVRLLARIEEVHAEMGKQRRRPRPTARRGSARKGSSRTASA